MATYSLSVHSLRLLLTDLEDRSRSLNQTHISIPTNNRCQDYAQAYDSVRSEKEPPKSASKTTQSMTTHSSISKTSDTMDGDSTSRPAIGLSSPATSRNGVPTLACGIDGMEMDFTPLFAKQTYGHQSKRQKPQF